MAIIDTIRRLLKAAPSSVLRNGLPIYRQFGYSHQICLAADAAEERPAPETLKRGPLKWGIIDQAGKVQACSVAEIALFLAQRRDLSHPGSLAVAVNVVKTVLNEASFGVNAPSLLGWILIRSINVQVQDWNTPVREFTYNRPPLAYEKIYHWINQAEGCKQVGIYPGLMCGFKNDIVPKALIHSIRIRLSG